MITLDYNPANKTYKLFDSSYGKEQKVLSSMSPVEIRAAMLLSPPGCLSRSRHRG